MAVKDPMTSSVNHENGWRFQPPWKADSVSRSENCIGVGDDYRTPCNHPWDDFPIRTVTGVSVHRSPIIPKAHEGINKPIAVRCRPLNVAISDKPVLSVCAHKL